MRRAVFNFEHFLLPGRFKRRKGGKYRDFGLFLRGPRGVTARQTRCNIRVRRARGETSAAPAGGVGSLILSGSRHDLLRVSTALVPSDVDVESLRSVFIQWETCSRCEGRLSLAVMKKKKLFRGCAMRGVNKEWRRQLRIVGVVGRDVPCTHVDACWAVCGLRLKACGWRLAAMVFCQTSDDIPDKFPARVSGVFLSYCVCWWCVFL